MKGHMGGLWGCRLDSLEVCSVIYLIPRGERSYGRAVGLPAGFLGGLLCDLSDPTG